MSDDSETAIAMDARVDLNVTWPTKNALMAIARERQISVSDVVRQALKAGLPFVYPEFNELMRQATEDYMNKSFDQEA
jgi:hypothetical protein